MVPSPCRRTAAEPAAFAVLKRRMRMGSASMRNESDAHRESPGSAPRHRAGDLPWRPPGCGESATFLSAWGRVILLLLLSSACQGDPVDPTEPTTLADNQPPAAVGTMPDLTMALNDTTAVDVAPYFNDPENDALSYSFFGASSANAWQPASTVSTSWSGSTLTIILTLAGANFDVTVGATDAMGRSAQQTFTITTSSG